MSKQNTIAGQVLETKKVITTLAKIIYVNMESLLKSGFFIATQSPPKKFFEICHV